MTHAPVLLIDVEASLAAPDRIFQLPPPIEAAFQRQSARERAASTRKVLLPRLLIYNSFLGIDWLLLHGTFKLAAILHLAIVTPLILVAGSVLVRGPATRLRNVLEVGISLLMVGQILLIYTLNSGPAADQYQYLVILVLVFMNINQRFDPRVALGASALMTVLYLLVLLAGDSLAAVKLVGANMFFGAAAITLTANHRMAAANRHMFLRGLQDRLRREGAEIDASRDALTGLWNRRGLEAELARLWQDTDGDAPCHAIILIDVDHFKLFNDHHGHPAGDTCLKRVAALISSELRGSGDMAVRFGGEEFVLLLPDTELPEAVRIAERIRRAIELAGVPHGGLGSGKVVTVSLGVLAGSTARLGAAELVAGADAALYAAKSKGRNRVWPPFLVTDERVVAIADAARSQSTPR